MTSGLASMFLTHIGSLGLPKLEPAIRMSWPYGTHSSGVLRGIPLLRPGTVSTRLGSPAMSSSVSRPRVTRWISMSTHMICGR
jgi:hypothetical protein